MVQKWSLMVLVFLMSFGGSMHLNCSAIAPDWPEVRMRGRRSMVAAKVAIIAVFIACGSCT
jgi:hypothetical protein